MRAELQAMGVAGDIKLLREKDGIGVARVASGAHLYVIKYFQKEEYRREIANYRLLSALGVPTVRVVATTDAALLLEDIAAGNGYRLGAQRDMDDPKVAKAVAAWYKRLHLAGRAYVRKCGAALYDESDCFTRANIAHIKEKIGAPYAPGWGGA